MKTNQKFYSSRELSNDEYHAIKALSSSHYKTIAGESLKHYYYKYLSGEYSYGSAAMNLGTYVHALLLEPENIEKEFHVFEKLDMRLKKNKETHAAMIEEHAEKTLIDSATHENAITMRDACLKNKYAVALLENSLKEHSITYSENGLDKKCRADLYAKNLAMVGDIKTANSFNAQKFSSEVRYRGYDIQAAFYCDSLDCDEFYIIMLESAKPFDVVAYKLDATLIEVGRKKYRKAEEDYKRAVETNIWPGLSEDLTVIEPTKFEIERFSL